MSFATGDRVKVINPGQTYDTYEEWATRHGARSWVRGEAPKGGLLCTIKTMGNHSRFSGDILALVESDNGQQYIMSLKGIEKINEETNMITEKKTAQEYGFKVGDRFEVVKASDAGISSHTNNGDILELVRDDGSRCPSFKNVTSGGADFYSYFTGLRPLLEFKEGDTLVNDDESYSRKVLGLIGDIVVTEDSDDESLNATRLDDLKDGGWELKGTEPETKEVTLGEIAEKFGVSVEQLRVKKGDE